MASSNWLDLSANSNIFGLTYVNNFIDLSGDLVIRNNGAIIIGGDASMNRLVGSGASKSTTVNDLTLNSNLLIGGNISTNGNVSIGGDLSLNGKISGAFSSSIIIPSTAVIGYAVTTDVSAISITGNVRIVGDSSFNGAKVDLSTNTLFKIGGQLDLSDGTFMTTYDDNILSGSFANGNVIFKDSTFDAVTVTSGGAVNVGGTVTTSSDYRIKTCVVDLDEKYSVDQLVPIHYDNTLTNTHDFGLIAHELQSVYPYLVTGEKDGPEYQRVHYNGLIGVLVKEVHDLKRRVVALE
jgi:hypothetical protein